MFMTSRHVLHYDRRPNSIHNLMDKLACEGLLSPVMEKVLPLVVDLVT